MNQGNFVLLTALSVFSLSVALVSSQYEREQQSYSVQTDGNEGSHEDEQPRARFGFRLRVPSTSFELPRFQLPRITIHARIRQPDGPRIIRLPEINIDTSSGNPSLENQHDSHDIKGDVPGYEGRYNRGYNYESLKSPMQAYHDRAGYSQTSERANTLTFSTGQEEQQVNYNHQHLMNQQAYNPHVQTYGMNQQAYSPHVQTYGMNQQAYSPHVQTYGMNHQAYSSHVQTYGMKQHPDREQENTGYDYLHSRRLNIPSINR